MNKKKLTQQQSMRVLQRNFKDDLSDIYREIGMFREGIKSFEVYTEQTANQLASNSKTGLAAKSSPLTMFHQIMYFLVLKDEMTTDAENFASNANSQASMPNQNSGFFPSFLPEEEI